MEVIDHQIKRPDKSIRLQVHRVRYNVPHEKFICVIQRRNCPAPAIYQIARYGADPSFVGDSAKFLA